MLGNYTARQARRDGSRAAPQWHAASAARTSEHATTAPALCGGALRAQRCGSAERAADLDRFGDRCVGRMDLSTKRSCAAAAAAAQRRAVGLRPATGESGVVSRRRSASGAELLARYRTSADAERCGGKHDACGDQVN